MLENLIDLVFSCSPFRNNSSPFHEKKRSYDATTLLVIQKPFFLSLCVLLPERIMITIANPEPVTYLIPAKLSRSETTILRRRVIKRQKQQHQMLLRGESRIYRSSARQQQLLQQQQQPHPGLTPNCDPLIIMDDPTSNSTVDFVDCLRSGI